MPSKNFNKQIIFNRCGFINQAIGADGSVGIWHETYLIEPGRYEAVYGNMPVFGLAAATKHVPAIRQRETARRRLGGDSEPAVPSPITQPSN
ncbi:monooxygenase family protein [Nostoc sp.]|uniref:monooxygenase family protein n=1 Tax=Nostoc sp. TaxID=1180 RepID=UPI002FFA1CBD